jgi:hypothetical protein
LKVLRLIAGSFDLLKRVSGGLQTLRLVRLLRIFDLVQVKRVKQAFHVLYEVVNEKRDDIAASLAIIFIAVVFMGT